jgi:hypothetical protein
MKNSEITLSQTLLNDLCSSLSLDPSTKSTAERLLKDFKSQDQLWEESKSRSIVRCAILTAYKIMKKRSNNDSESPLSLVSLLSGPHQTDIHSFIRKLKEFIKFVPMDERASPDINSIINSYAFSLTLYNKFEDVCSKLRLGTDNLRQVKRFMWIIFILARINILQRRCDIVECACMLLGTFHVFLALLPVGGEVGGDPLLFLCSTIKASQEQVKLASDHLRMMIEKFKEHNHLRGTYANSSNIEGILDQNHLWFNIKSVSSEYSSKLLPDDIDEKEFLMQESDLGSPLKVKDSVQNSQRFCNKRMLDYEDDESLSMTSRLQDIKFPSLVSNSPYSIKTFPPCSRMITSYELENWINSHIEGISCEVPEEILEKMDTSSSSGFLSIIKQFKDLIKNSLNNIQKFQSSSKPYLSIPSNKLTPDSLLRFFFKVLTELLKNEEKQQELRSETKDQLINVLKNETFYRALLVCCIETVLYVNNITALEFSEVLDICSVSAFDTWKLMKNFLEFDSRIPSSLRQHFKSLEAKVISSMAWTENSPIAGHIRAHLSSKKDLTHPAILMFCRRVLAYCALRIYDLGNMLNISEEVREDIWAVMKNGLSEETELFINREMDQIIICTIYGVCKAKGLNVTFNNLISKYTEFYNDNGRLFRCVRLEGSTTGDIIRFYNDIFVKYMKNYLMSLTSKTGNIARNDPRIPCLNPSSPLKFSLPPPMIIYSPSENRYSLNSPARSPYATPRSKRIYAFGESPSYHLDAINHMMSKSGNCLDIDDDKLMTPTKRAKLNDSLCDDNFDLEENQLEFGDDKDSN